LNCPKVGKARKKEPFVQKKWGRGKKPRGGQSNLVLGKPLRKGGSGPGKGGEASRKKIKNNRPSRRGTTYHTGGKNRPKRVRDWGVSATRKTFNEKRGNTKKKELQDQAVGYHPSCERERVKGKLKGKKNTLGRVDPNEGGGRFEKNLKHKGGGTSRGVSRGAK